jgi:long-chain acyl-CoA synthetase
VAQLSCICAHLRPEFVREAFTRFKITYVALVPLILKNLQAGLQKRFDELPPLKRFVFDRLLSLNKALTKQQPKLELSRKLLKQVHEAFGGELRAIFTGGAFSDPQMLQFFYDLGLQVGNGYGLTEAGTAITLNDFKPFRADTVGKPLPGMEVEIRNPDADGIGTVAVRSNTVMSHYLDEPELTAETIVGGWLLTGDLGRFDAMGHLQLFGRAKNMIVTEEGKNVYPEDIENAFEGCRSKSSVSLRQLHLAGAFDAWREARHCLAAERRPAIHRRVETRDHSAQWQAAQFQTHQRLRDLG